METLVTYGSKTVAEWCGVTPPAVSNWIVRHWQEIPKPDAVIVTEQGERYGWVKAREHEWRAFAEKHAGQSAARNRARHYS